MQSISKKTASLANDWIEVNHANYIAWTMHLHTGVGVLVKHDAK